MSRRSLWLVLICVLPVVAFGQAGGRGMSFLKNGVGAAVIAMGDAGTAEAPSAVSMQYNPAILAGAERASVSINHRQWIENYSSQYLGAVAPLGGITMAFHAGLTSVGDIELRTVPGDAQGTASARYLTTGISAAVPIADGIDAGATAKFLYEKIFVDEASGYAFDLGVSAAPFNDDALRNLRFGAAVMNLGGMSPLRTESTALPALIRAGAAYAMPIAAIQGTLRASLDAVSTFGESATHVNAGVEASYAQSVYIRVGYQSGYDTRNVTVGIGVSYGSLSFDYAAIPASEPWGLAHAFSLSFLF